MHQSASSLPLEADPSLQAIGTRGNTDTVIHFVDMASSSHDPLDAMHVPSDTLDGMVDTSSTLKIAEFIREQAKDTYCRTTTSQVDQPSAKLHINHYELLVRRSTVDSEIQILVPTPLRQRILTLAHYSRMAEHRGQGQVFDTLGREFFWCHMANELYRSEDRFDNSAHNQNHYQPKRPL